MADKVKLREELERRRLLTPGQHLLNWLKPTGLAGISLLATALCIFSTGLRGGSDRSWVTVSEGVVSVAVTAGIFLVFTLLAILRYRDWRYIRRTSGVVRP